MPHLRATVLMAVGLLGCEGTDGLRKLSATGFFNPPEIDFGVRTIGLPHELTTELTNTAPEDLRVLDIRTEPKEDVFLARLPDDTLSGSLLERGSRHTVTIFYNPQEERTYDTSMYLVFSDFEIELPIRAGAELIPPAAPSLSPARITFPLTEVGRDVMQVVTITNVGETDGSLKTIKGAGSPFSVRAVGGGPLVVPSGVLSPGAALSAEVHYQPTSETHSEASIEFAFDTGELATLSVSGDSVVAGTLTCAGPIDFGAVPRGVRELRTVNCTASGVYNLAEARFTDSSSLLFSIPNPPASLGPNDTLSFEVQFESAGLASQHNGTLELVAAHGVVTRVNMTGTVDPPLPGTTDLQVQLEWNTPWSDFDLHLVRAGGNPFSSVNDCHFASKNPDWGDATYPGDDPFLDRDDVDGFGPEEISLTFVGDSDPVYDLYVQYHQYSRETAPATTVTITYQMRDQSPRTVSRDMFVCGNLWHVGRFRFDFVVPQFELIDIENDAYKNDAGERCR